jgi:hypothetical protein
LGNGLLKGIEIDDYQVDRSDLVSREIRLMLGEIWASQNPAVNAGVQGFHPTVEDLGGAGVVRHFGDGQSGVLQGLSSAAAAE